ncbi:MAG: ABC transporter substrate-binding protein [Anaerolineae bacterium]|nr:ABC transporter substrate-binding protein [Anaerolineae bacterium]
MLRKISLVVITILILSALPSVFAGGPVYDELPDLEGREVVVAVENFYTPFQFNDPRADEAIGFEYDLINEICNRLNCTPVYETTSFDLQLAGVADGTYELAMNGLFITEERQQTYDFSIPYFSAETYLMVRADEDRFTSIQDFIEKAESEDLAFGAQAGSFSQIIATEIHPIPEDQVVTFDDFTALLVSLANGDIDAMAVDAFGGKFVGTNSEVYKLIGDPLVEPVPVGLIFTKGSDLVEPFNAAIDSMTKDGYLSYLAYKWSTDFQPLAEE